MKHPAAEAWETYKQSREYQQLFDIMKKAELRADDAYLESRILQCFNAGWNACGKAIMQAGKEI